MMAADYSRKAFEYTVIVRPNNSMTWRSTKILFSAVTLVTMVIALIFAVKGAWLVLPFAGMEILALGICLYICACKNAECEIISIDDEIVRVEKGRNQPRQCFEFQRAWSRVSLSRNKLDWYPSRLTICSMGREVEVGVSLAEEDRMELANELQRKLT